jgi:hypothetical protein
VQRVQAADQGEGQAQRCVDVDVGGAVTDVVTVEARGENVEARVDAAACGEGLPPQPVAAG